MGTGASSFLGVQSPASGVEKQIAYYKQGVCRVFCLVFPWKSISNFIFDLISQVLGGYLLTSFLLSTADLIWKNSLVMFETVD